MSLLVNRQLILANRPVNIIDDQTFIVRESAVPTPGPGEALVKVAWLGIEPTQRNWLNDDPGYIDPVRIGSVMRGAGAGQVIESQRDDLVAGQWVVGTLGWQDYAIVGEHGLFGITPVPPGIDPKLMLGLFGSSGLTAYFGMTEIGRPVAGETVLVTGAAGAVGSIASQIARLQGARVIGITGSSTKATWLTDEARLDAAINYRTENVRDRLASLAPQGVNVFFDNVGGSILEMGLDAIADHARIVLCGGMASGYTQRQAQHGPRNYMELGFRRARMEGFIFLDYVDRFPEAFGHLAAWYQGGELAYVEHISDGLTTAPGALQGLFSGHNLGKQLVRLEG